MLIMKRKKEIQKEAPLAPFDPRHKKPGDQSLQANEDLLNAVNEQAFSSRHCF